jgi:hypothetical protein
VDDRLQQLREARQDVEAALRLEKAHQKEAYEDGKKTAEEFKVGDMVWLNSEDIKVRIPSKKLGNKYLGPFEIIERIGDLDYKLKLPQDLCRLHNNFHIDKLYRWKGNEVNGLLPPPPEPVIIDEEEEFEVDEILDSQLVPGRGRKKASLKYLVSWKG